MKEITLPKPKAILFDLGGTVIKPLFVDKILVSYIRDNINEYVSQTWNSEQMREDIERLRRLSAKEEFINAHNIASEESNEEDKQKSVIAFVLWCMDNNKEHKNA